MPAASSELCSTINNHFFFFLDNVSKPLSTHRDQSRAGNPPPREEQGDPRAACSTGWEAAPSGLSPHKLHYWAGGAKMKPKGIRSSTAAEH